MTTTTLLVAALLAVSAVVFNLGCNRARSILRAGGGASARIMHSRPPYHGLWSVLWSVTPAVLVLALWAAAERSVVTALVVDALPSALGELPPERLGLVVNEIRNVAAGVLATQPSPEIAAAAEHYRHLSGVSHGALAVVVLALAALGAAVGLRTIEPSLRARNHVERAIWVFLVASSTVAIFTTIGIVLSVLFESMRFFAAVPVSEFLFGTEWSPQTAIRADQVGSSGAFGAVPLFTGTLMISFIAMLVAAPVGLLSAIYLAEYATPRLRAVAKPVLEILAGIPTVVYGFFAALTVAPWLRGAGEALGLSVSSESALAAGVVMGLMLIPFISSLSDDVINAVPQAMRDGSYALGATRSETIVQVIIPAALPGIVGGFLLAVSRAIGETMIVVMAAGLAANLTANPLEAVTTVTVQIVTLLVGDQEFDSPKTLAAFALGLVLFAVTLVLNVIALHVVRKYREQYE
ncbi:MAG: phosphate ABC transporter permease subunit PstC [Ectothiorhodospiraceae bacterium]|nr:phosphate ABC transporter permease subunit PstC [Ectothiorhodospiraceae bacterium]